jgi:hypothetical protein
MGPLSAIAAGEQGWNREQQQRSAAPSDHMTTKLFAARFARERRSRIMEETTIECAYPTTHAERRHGGGLVSGRLRR